MAISNSTRILIFHHSKDFLLSILGVLSAAFGLKGFLLPNEFIDGGATGISLLMQLITRVPFGFILVLVNLPFILLALRTVNFQFALKSIVSIIFLAIATHFLEFPIITSDKLLISVFGGFFLGMGIGLAMRGGSVIDGTEVLAIYLSKKLSLTIGDIILLFNIVIFSFGAYMLSVEIALYAILTYISASKTVDYVIDGVEEYIGVTIISRKSDEVRTMITEKLGRGCTIYMGKSGYAIEKDKLESQDIVFTVITRLELARMQTEVDLIDKEAFMVMGVIQDTHGGMIKKKAAKKIKKPD